MTDDFRYPLTVCWHCDRPLDAATNVPGQEAVPHPGAVSLCLYCGAIAIFEEELALRKPTEEELDSLFEDQTFRSPFTTFQRMRQYLMIKESLMRERKDPDR